MPVVGGKNETREFKEYPKYVGLFVIDGVLAINPTKEQQNKLYGNEPKEDEKELEYLKETEDGEEKLLIDIYLKPGNSKIGIKKHSISLINKIRENQNKTKIQVVNQVGDFTWVEKNEDGTPNVSLLKESFTKFKSREGEILGEKWVKPAFVGQELLYVFLKAIYDINWWNASASLDYNFDKLFKGNISELKSDVDNIALLKPIALVSIVTNDIGDKQYERVFGGAFLKQGLMKFVNNGYFNNYDKKNWDRFVQSVTDVYGAKGFYILKEAREYNKEEDVTIAGKENEQAVNDVSGPGY